MKRKLNFYPGPSTLPLSVLEELRDTLVEYHGEGLSLLEASHRGGIYEKVHTDAVSLIRELLEVPAEFSILFLGGGATLQFAMVPLNLLSGGKSCDFVVSGSWAKKALEDAQKIGTVNILYDGASEKYSNLPDTVTCSAKASYLNITSNETIDGVQWPSLPDSGNVPLVVDMSSDIMSRRFSFGNVGVVYAGAQKNLGPAGVTVVIIRKDIVDSSPAELPAYLSYAVHAKQNSLYNTPPSFSIYALKLVLEYIKREGGLKNIEKLATKKSSLIYDAIDSSGGFYKCKVSKGKRSKMNVVFNLPTEDLEKQFLKEAAGQDMLGLPGHRSVGGCRASLYNAVPVEWAETLASFMREFASKNG
ncbi:MAG: 3-phosphoserine/phosphohydroxythreonine transaminase [Spirochaetales bacterium]|nr:3-phosphoserine/phosphohydroxythreonine transaminase [Spirochaetales bacterium]